MSEKQRKREQENGASFTIGEHRFTPDNSELRFYSEMPEADHFLLYGKGTVFRVQVPNFDDITTYAEEAEYPIYRGMYPEDKIMKAYLKRFPAPPLPEFGWTSPRHEHMIAFGRYAMDHMNTVEDLFRD